MGEKIMEMKNNLMKQELAIEEEIQNVDEEINAKQKIIEKNKQKRCIKNYKRINKWLDIMTIAFLVYLIIMLLCGSSLIYMQEKLNMIVNISLTKVLFVCAPMAVIGGALITLNISHMIGSLLMHENDQLKKHIDLLNEKKTTKYKDLQIIQRKKDIGSSQKTKQVTAQLKIPLPNDIKNTPQIGLVPEKPKRRSLVNHPFDI